MRKRIAILAVYFVFTPVFLFFFILYFLYLSHAQTGANAHMLTIFNQTAQFQALPDERVVGSDSSLQTADAREHLLEVFLARYNSPLLPYAQLLVTQADKNGLDFRLLPAIAMQESNLCKKIPKHADFNCWGFGIYGSKRTSFTDYSTAITTVAKTLGKDYVNQGLSEPAEIMARYTPGSNGSWANSVNYFMNEINNSW